MPDIYAILNQPNPPGTLPVVANVVVGVPQLLRTGQTFVMVLPGEPAYIDGWYDENGTPRFIAPPLPEPEPVPEE